MNTVLLILGSQGIFSGSYLLFSKRGNLRANKLLGFVLMEFAFFIIIPSLMRIYGDSVVHLTATTFPILFLMGPTMFLYVIEFTGYKKRNKYYFLNFVPAIIVLLYLTNFFTLDSTEKVGWLNNARYHGLPFDFTLIWLLSCIHLIVYFFKSTKYVNRFQAQLSNFFSDLERNNLNWLLYFIYGNAVLWTLYLLVFILFQFDVFVDPLGISDLVFTLLLGLFLYGIGYNFLVRPEVFASSLSNRIIDDEEKYKKTNVTSEFAEEKLYKLKELMSQKRPYLDEDLSLDNLSSMLSISQKKMSQIINQSLNKNFYEFINEYRIEEAKRLLSARNNPKILAIALDSGFKSKSTFNKAFKDITGMTPSKYRESVRSI
ncbi:MAG: helix-turn-helix domain-containing protein [Saonia sp.]